MSETQQDMLKNLEAILGAYQQLIDDKTIIVNIGFAPEDPSTDFGMEFVWNGQEFVEKKESGAV